MFFDLAYGPDPAQQLDLYIPTAPSSPRPLLIWIHGGAWDSGDKYPPVHAVLMVAYGWAVASINYRLSDAATFPAQIHDCKGAVRWLRAHAQEYNFDPGRFAVWGPSAGGHLAALVGTAGSDPDLEGTVGGNLAFSSRVQAVVDYYGVTDFYTEGGEHDACDSPDSLLLGQCLGEVKAHWDDPDWADWVALVQSAGSANHVSPEDPPFYIAHGTEDNRVPPSQSQELYDLLIAAGVPATLRMVPGAHHGLPDSEDQYVYAFLNTQLSAPLLLGDLNCDGAVDLGDIDPFVLALAGGEMSFLDAYPGGNWYAGDLSGDGLVDFCDISPFVQCVVNGGCP